MSLFSSQPGKKTTRWAVYVRSCGTCKHSKNRKMQHLLSVHNPVSPYHYSVDCISRSLNLSLFTQPCRARLSRGIHVVMGAFSFGLFLVRTGCGNRFDSMATESRCCLICPLKKTISPQLSELPISITKGI